MGLHQESPASQYGLDQSNRIVETAKPTVRYGRPILTSLGEKNDSVVQRRVNGAIVSADPIHRLTDLFRRQQAVRRHPQIKVR